MINLILRQNFYRKIKQDKESENDHIHYSDCAFNSSTHPEYVVDYFPWGKDRYKITRTTYGIIKQVTGIFNCKMKTWNDGCFWLLNISENQYNEIDHFEFRDDHIQVGSQRNRHGGGQYFFTPEIKISPLYEGPMRGACKTFVASFKSPEARNWVISKAHVYTIIWKRWFILWKIDGIPVALCLKRSAIPQQHMYMLATNMDFIYFESGRK